MKPYAVFVSDLRQPCDVVVRRFSSREPARKLARILNRRVVREVGHRLPDGTVAPLYFAVRETEGG